MEKNYLSIIVLYYKHADHKQVIKKIRFVTIFHNNNPIIKFNNIKLLLHLETRKNNF